MTKFGIAFRITAAVIALAAFSPANAVDLSQGFSGANVGALGGAVAGGVGGNYLAKKGKLGKTGQLAATIGGTLAGGLLGGALGKQLDAPSRTRAASAQMTAVSTGTRQTWQSPYHAGAPGAGTWGRDAPSGASTWNNAAPSARTTAATASGGSAYGTVEPGNPYQTESGICRDYTHTINIDGRKETARGIACRNPDGSWRNAG